MNAVWRRVHVEHYGTLSHSGLFMAFHTYEAPQRTTAKWSADRRGMALWKYHHHYRPESWTTLVTKYRLRAFLLCTGLHYIHRTVTEPVILSTAESREVGRSGCLATRTFPSSRIEPATFRVPRTGPRRSKTFSSVNRSRRDGCVAAAAVGVRMCECETISSAL